jgi:hypothetical protein
MAYLSDVNLRAVLVVLVGRAGGSVEISNDELYDAMMPDSGGTERFVVTESAGGVQVSLHGAAPFTPPGSGMGSGRRRAGGEGP